MNVLLWAAGAAEWLRIAADRLDSDNPLIYTSEWGPITAIGLFFIFALIGLVWLAFALTMRVFRAVRRWHLRRRMRRELHKPWHSSGID